MEKEYEDSDSDNFDDEEDEIDEGEQTKCLFCENQFASIELAVEHVNTIHGISLPKLKGKFNMDQYSYIKLINCIRIEKLSADKISSTTSVFWSDDKYLKPVEYESWLSYDFEEIPADSSENQITDNISEEYRKMQALVTSLTNKLRDRETILEHAAEGVSKMRIAYNRLLEKDATEGEKRILSAIANSTDTTYFGGYSHFGIHQDMLSDTVRTNTYRDSLLKNKDFINGKVILDVGCGTSILSIFASQAGAKQVIAIDNSRIINNAIEIVKKNKIPNIEFVKGRVENTSLPVKKVDIIISEWMGYFLLFEGMLESVICARDKHLKEGGIMMPNRCTLNILAYGDEDFHNKNVNFWDSVYGVDMSPMKTEVLQEPLVEVVDVEHVLTEANMIADFDLATVKVDNLNFSYDFKLKCIKEGRITSFVGYFDTFFGGIPNPVEFSTSPFCEPTHWKQVLFFLEKPVEIKVGEIVGGTLVCKRSRHNKRSLDITITAFGKNHIYYLD